MLIVATLIVPDNPIHELFEAKISSVWRWCHAGIETRCDRDGVAQTPDSGSLFVSKGNEKIGVGQWDVFYDRGSTFGRLHFLDEGAA